jgi:uncharacterized membrane protein SpoIIM required for sporulation
VNILKEELFIKKNTDTWKELELLSSKVIKKGIKALSSQEIKKFLYLFRKSSHHLAYARTHYPKSSIVVYLNALIGKCHSHVYAVKRISPTELFSYLAYGFPKLLKEYKFYILSSFGFFAIGAILSLVLVLINPDNAILFLPQNYIDGIKSGAAGGGQWNYPLMSSYIMVNNISVSLRAFAFGITLGLGTIYVLFFNGAMIGALTGIVYLYGDPINFWSLILPHGVIELTAIFISGAAGLIIAKHLLIPGEYSRFHSLIKGSKKAVSLVIGIIFMLIIAGIIEGFFTPLNIGVELKLSFAGITAVLLIVYFSTPYVFKKKASNSTTY